MTIKELKEKIKNLPDSMEVYISERKTLFAYGLVNSVQVKEIPFTENPFPTEKEIKKAPKIKVLILNEE